MTSLLASQIQAWGVQAVGDAMNVAIQVCIVIVGVGVTHIAIILLRRWARQI